MRIVWANSGAGSAKGRLTLLQQRRYEELRELMRRHGPILARLSAD